MTFSPATRQGSLNREWTLDVNKTRYIPTIIVVLAIIAVLAAIIFQSMN